MLFLKKTPIIMTPYMRTTLPPGPIGRADIEPVLFPINPETGSPDASRWLYVWHHEARRDPLTQRGSMHGPVEIMNAPSMEDRVRPDDADYSFSAHECSCPRCNGTVTRIPRRVIDLLASLFMSVSRYRCRSMDCGWEGNLRLKRRFPLIRGPW